MSGSQLPWRDGFWKNRDTASFLVIIEGDKSDMKNLYCLDYPEANSFVTGKLVSGDFGATPQEIREVSGADTYNMQWEFSKFNLKEPAVVSSDGTCIHKCKYGRPGFDTLEWLDERQVEELKENREPEEAPSLPSYITPTPAKMGKLLWFSGPPGAGKSTTAQLFGKHHSFVYYEADCFGVCVNPFIDIHVEDPSMSLAKQKSLKGRSIEVIKLMEAGEGFFQQVQKGQFDDVEEKMNALLHPMAHHIEGQRKRIGGDWAVAWACFSRDQRDKLRQILGPHLVHIVLKMTKECVNKRLTHRHGDAKHFIETLEKMHQLYEDADNDEENAFNIIVDETMSENDVVKKVLETLDTI